MEELVYLERVDSTNTWMKERAAGLADGAAVYSACQTAGRGRLGRVWENAAGKALYFSYLCRRPLVQPAAFPLVSSLWTAQAVREIFGAECTIKWPNDLLLNGKKLVGILCESLAGADGACYISGIGVNLAQSREDFSRAQLPYATSLALEGAADAQEKLEALARRMQELFWQQTDRFAQAGLAPFLEEYRAACVNIGRPVVFEGGRGVAEDVDAEGRLVVRTAQGVQQVFTGEVSVRGIYGAV